MSELPALREQFEKFCAAAWERIAAGEQHYSGMWRLRDGDRDVQQEVLDAANYGFFEWCKAQERRRGHGYNALVYVSGPYTGDRIANVAAARAAGQELMRRGYTPLVPHTMYDDWDLGTELRYARFIAACLALVPICGHMLMLPGWEQSPGAQAERRRAEEIGVQVWEEMLPHLP